MKGINYSGVIYDLVRKMIYLDNAATTMTYQEVVDKMLEYFTELYGNPSSVYEFAGKSKEAIEEARQVIANSIGAKPSEIYFTSGGTESDNWALRSTTKVYKEKGKHIITTKIEHPAVLNTAKTLEDLGYEVTYLDVYENGMVNVKNLIRAIRPDTVLISIMAANNEIGTLQPIGEIGKICREKSIIFHTDAVQMYGQLPINVNMYNIDMLSASAHKFHGPKGVGFLYVREKIEISPLIFGGGQENHKRAGTQNVPSIVGMAYASKICHNSMQERIKHEIKLRDYMIKRILREIPFSRINGDISRRLPGNTNFSFQFVDSSEILASLDLKGICASSGSACSSNSDKPSHVLMAIGLPEEIANSSLRLTLCESTTIEEIDYVIDTLKDIIFELRKSSTEFTEYFAK